ncbi:hypothetical protein JCM6882_002921 [Rhodosporidiobolus microsporus]
MASADRPKSIDTEEKASLDDSRASSEVVALDRSRGAKQAARLTARMTPKYRILLYGSFTLLAYVLSLDAYTSRSYLSAAVSAFGAHSTLTTVNALASVFKAVSQPPLAKLSNVIGRIECYAFCVFLYTLGYVIVSASPNIYAFAAGNVINTIGSCGLSLLEAVIIADTSSLRNRLFWLIFPQLPGTINGWVNGNIAQSLLGARNEHIGMWRWGYGKLPSLRPRSSSMLCILVPALATPVMITLGIGMGKRRDEVEAKDESTAPRPKRTLGQQVANVFWELDLPGLLLVVAGFGMFLTIITIANGKGSNWSDAHCIALLVVGPLLIAAFCVWETYFARSPLLSKRLLKNRNVLTCLACGILYPIAGGIIQSYFYTYMLVTVDETTMSATRLNWVTAFVGTWTTAVVGIAARYIRYLKPIVIAGFILDVLALGLYVRFRNGDPSQGAIAGVQVLRGIAGGMIGYPLSAAIQTVATRDQIGAVTAAKLLAHNLAAGIGSAIGGGLWSNLVPGKLDKYISDPSLASLAFKNPIGLIAKYPIGTEVRDGMARAHGETQRIIAIVATCIAAVGLFVSFFLESVKLTDEVTLEEYEQEERKIKAAQH